MSEKKTIEVVSTDNYDLAHSMSYKDELIPNAVTTTGDSVLQVAVAKDSAISFLLLDAGANVNYQNKEGNTALHVAASLKIYDLIVKKLLAKGGSLDVQNNKGETPMHVAAQKAPFHVLSCLTRTKTKPNLSIQDENGYTALHTLCQYPLDKVKHVKTLLKLGADVDGLDKEGKTPLLHILETIQDARIEQWYSEGHNGDRYVEYKIYNGLFTYYVNKEKRSFSLKDQRYCAEKDWGPKGQTLYYDALDIALTLVKTMTNFTVADQEGNTPFLLACKIGEPRLIKALIKAGADTSAVNKMGENALHAVVRSGRLDALKVFFKQVEVTNINVTDMAGWSVLHHLVDVEDNLDIFKYLQRRGGDLSLASTSEKDNFPVGTLALQIAKAKDRTTILPLLDIEKDDFSIDEIRQAALYGQLAVVEKYLKDGGDVEMKDEHHTMSILLAVARNDQQDDNPSKMITLLLKYGADINAVQGGNFNALMLCINSLYNKGSRVLAFDNEYMEHVKIAKILINQNINLAQAKSGVHQKALRDAAEVSPEITKMIVEKLVKDYANYKQELDHQDSDGFTALHVAARSGNMTTVKLLVEAGATINLPEMYGFIPVHEAIIAGKHEVVQYLMEQGADVKHTISIGYGSYRAGDDAKAIANKAGYWRVKTLFA